MIIILINKYLLQNYVHTFEIVESLPYDYKKPLIVKSAC